MIAAAFLVLLRPYSIQCALFLLLLLLGTIATILFFCCWHRRLQKGRHPIKSVFSGRSRSRDAVMRTHHFRSEVIYLARNFKGFRSSPRHARRRVAPRLEETQPIVEAHHLSEQETSVRKRKIKKSSRVQPEFYHSVQVTPTRKPSSGNASYRCSMSSSADFSDEEDFSQRSGTVSPAPGDTLPWNLPKHERSKRKIQGGSVLDPAERAVLRIADERDKVQKKTFTKWINQHLMKVRKHVNDLYEDLRDGHNLISLLEVLSGDTLPREKGRMRFHRLQNVQIALDYLKKRQVKLVNIRNDDITDGNPKLTLGLIWTIILHFQISDIHVTGESEDMSAKERLLLWSQQTTEGYAGIRCENFTTCWRDGRLFNAIIHKYRPDLIDMNTVAVQSNLANLEHAFFVAEKLGVARLLDPEALFCLALLDVDVSSPDEKSVITYVSSLYDAFPKVPEGGEGISANDVEVKWVEYQNMVNYLMQWIRHHVTIMSDRTFPNNPVELKALYNQYLQFKETEIPPKETDKSKIKHLYKLLEVWIEFGRIKLSQGYHPNDIEKEWGKLIIAMLEREKTLRPEVERLEMLQQIANRIQRDSRSCEDKLILARNALQSDTKRLESGLQFQHEAEIAGYLLESENLLRQQVIDAQILIDGKYYQADQLVQRVAKLRDDLMALRTECSSVYSKGHALTTEQTKLMISGITESLNSGFTANLTPELNAAMTQGLTPTLTSGLSSGLSSRLTPTVTPAYPSGIPPRLIQSYVTGVDSGTLQTLKLMQIRKPLMKSAFVDQNLTEEEVNMKFVQDLLSWVEEMQVQLDRAEWGSDLPSVESHLENHKNVHKAIEEFESSLKEAKISEIQMTAPLKLSYAEKLHKLESQYSKLLNTSRNQERHLDTLHNFVSRATRELIWLNEKEEEEVAYDWSERNPNITRKKEYHAELMRELDEKEEVIKSVQEIAEQLLLENHPARLTIEAYRAAMQTQWSWILQLCHCVEQHLRENAAYFEFFSDAKEAMEYLKNLKDTIYRKYSCDRSSSLHRLEDLVQESMEEKEQLLQYKSTVAGLVGRAKAIIQLKPRNPDCILKTSIPIKAICDYRQIEITIYKDDECVLANNSHRAKWKVISPSGNEAMVPSVCFTVPPPNKEAIDTANRIEQQFQNVLALWHESHVNMKSVVSWHYLTNEIEVVRAGNVASIKTMLPGEHQQVLSNLQSRFDDFVEDSQESKIFTSSDTAQLEREVNVCKQYYQELLKSAEREEQEESIYNLYISEVRNIRLRLESCEERLIRQIRTPMERDDVHENVLRISEQEKLKKELDRLKDDLGVITDKCEEFFSQAAGSPSVPTLRSELNVVIQNMNQVYSMSSIFIDKLKTINLVLTNTQTAESLVKHYETKLCEEEAVTADKSNIENLMGTLKQWRSEVDEKRQTFHALEDELQKAKMISDQMFKMHKERDLDFDWHKEKVDQLAERWQNVHSQIENRLRDLEGINKSLKYYKDTYNSLDTWIQQMEDTQRKIQEVHPENSKALAKQLNQHKMLVSEIEMKQSKIDECQKYSEQYSAAVKDYELQTMTYRAMVDSQQKSPVKRRRIQSSSDFIIQEFMDLRTRYTALVTLMTQYIKFAGDSLKRLEEEEKSMEEEKKEHVEKAGDLLKWVSNLSKTLSKEEGEKAEKTDLPKQQISLHEMSTKKEQIAEALQTTQSFLAKHSDKMSDEERHEMEKQVRSLQESYSLLSNEALKQLQEAHLGDEKIEEKDVAERQQECKEKLQEICDLLTQTENRLIGQRQSLGIGDSKAELEQYQTKQEEIQKDMRTSAQTLAEIVKNTEAFLKENGEKLSQEDKTILEQKLNEAKTKCLLLSQKAEESKKELDKAMTTAIKQETEKVAAIEQLEESKNTIENLLDWLSNVDKEAEHGRKFKQVIEQNGTHFEEGDVKVLEGEEDDVNGNLLEMQQDIETQVDGLVKSIDDNLNQQYQKVKAQHEKIISQQQAIIVATQSAQALLEKQGHYLTPEEKDKMQRNMKELKAQYETALAESERKMKLTHSLREELEKFDADYSEFEMWLQQAEQELDNLEAGASDFSGIMVKLKRQKSFSEDVISHKGDLRYITISGQRVLDAARSCSKRDGVKVDKDGIDTSATYAEVQNKLDRASDRFKSLYTKCSILGNNLKDLVDKYQHYEDASSGLLSGLQASEIAVNKQLSEPIAVDPKNLQRQLEETKVLQGQVSNHQIAVEKLKKAAEVLLDTRGELTPDKDEIQKTLDDIVERYDNLSKSVNERNEKLQVTLTRSLSVQDGLDEMLDWMEGVEKSLKEQDQVPLNSAAIQDIISKSIMLEQDIAGRQSSINTMNEKVKKFMETADPSTASTLQAKMSELAGRFSEASNKHREKLMKMEELKTKVELFEGLSTKLQSFLDEKNRALSETEAPRKDVSEVSQYMQEASIELAQHKKDLEVLKQLLEELSFHALPGDKALVSEKVNALSKKFKEVEETIKEKEEDVSSCQKQMDAFEFLVESLKKWIKETTERIPAARPSLNTEELKKPLEDTLNLKDEWTLKAPELQKMNSRGTLLCNLITAVTSPAKLRAVAKSGGTILNGEGGAPGTQDFLKNKELTTVQQAMSNVNHSYEDLGVLLNEKISELESMLSKMQNIQEESASMMHWLQKMDKTASDWEAAPTDSEAVKAQVEQHKLFETELKQSANKVQELKDKVTELLEKNPNSPEAPKWRQTLDKIDSKWKELNQVTSERQQKLEESSNYLIQFQTAEAQLKHWLVEKELMVSVLGPLSIDPNMLNTQKQQVQILLKEFDTRKPQYEQLTMAGQGILERPGEHPPSHEIVKEQLAAVAQKWDSLTSQLKKRCDRIDQAIVKSTEYQSLLRSLSDKLSALDNKLSSSLAVSTQPDAVKQQLEIAKEMKEEIEQEMKNINAAQALCEELSTLVGEEYLKAELTRQLDGILKSFKDIEQKSDNHVQQLQSAYTTSHQFQQMSKDFAAWLSKKKEELSQARPVSAKLEALQSLIEEQKDFKKTMTDQISSYERIVAEGESILQKTQGDDKAELQSQIATLKNDWDEMNKKVKEREDKLADCLEKALKYKQHVENLQPWIEKCQSNLCELKVGINPVEIEDSIVQVRAWQKDLDKHHGMVELLNNSAESLLNASQTDKEIIQEETKVLNQNVKVVTEQLHKKRECLENMAQRLKEFQDSSRETERQLKSAKEHLEAHDSLGPQSFSNKHLTMMQAQQKALQALKPHVDLAKKLAQDLVVEASDSAGVSDLLLQAESLEQEYTAVKQQVEDRCSFLETKLQGIGHFQNSIREMFSQFAEFDDELDSMAPVGRDLKVLQSQREDIKCFMKKLEDLIINNENANKNCKIMLATEAEASPDLVGIKRDLEALNKQCNKLKDRAKAREDQVEGTICRVEEFYTKLKEFSTLLGRAEEHEESQGPVGMETEAINQQLDTFKVFQKEEIEPLQVKQQEVNWLGQGLIQSAAKSTSTENLEHDLEDVNTRWKTLNKKVAQRAAQLQEALLHCGRFQDALESLLSWLIDTEDLVANQKPPSAEFKVVKAQIQEQKLLQRLLDDRKPTVEAIKREGEKIAESAEPADRVKILKQLSFLDSRWDALLSKAETRNRQLEGISVVAQQFHEALEPLVEWLTATEKRLANAEPIGTQASKLQQQIAQHKDLQEEILLRKQNVDLAIQNGLELLKQTTGDEVVIVQDKLEGIKARYKDITKLSSDVSKTLEQALQLAGQLHSTHEELCKWLDEVEMELLSYETQIPKGEELSQVQERQKELKKEAKNNKGLVDTLNEVGSAFLELVPWRAREGLDKMITEDNERYRLVSDTISQKVDEIDAAFLRSQQFDQAADAEFAWIAETEKKLMSLGDIRLEQDQTTAQLQVQKAFTMEILRHKDTIDELVKSGDKIMKTCTEEEKQMMKKKIENLLQKYDQVCQMNSERNLQLERAQSLVNQFWETYEELWPWLTETEMIISQLPAPALEYETLKQQQEEHRQLRELIAEHKPHIDKMNKTGPQLLELSPGEGFSIQEKYVAADTLYSKIKEDVKKRALALDEAISQCTQFHDKIDPTLESLKRIVERLRQPPSISAEVEKIKEQISENKNVSVDLEKLQPVYETLKQRGEEMIARSEGADKDVSAKAVQDKLDQMVLIWEDIQTLTEEREAKLLDVMELAEKFWCDHMALVATIKDTQDFIRELEGPGVDPSVVKQQQEAAEAAKEEIDGLQEELEAVVSLGSELRAACGEPDKPIVNKSIDELNSAWDALNKTWKERVDKLGEAMQAAVQYQDGLQALFDWVDIAGSKLASMSPVGTDLETVKQQTEELKQFKTEAYQQQIEMERLNHQAELLLKKATQESDKHTVQDPLSELRLLWDSLEDKIISRQHKLEGALLALGQFQHALDELLAWLTHTEDLLNEQKPVGGDPKAIEIELAKHHVLQNDVFAHQSTVEAVKKAGNDLIESSAVEEASNLRSKLELLNQRWQNLLEKTEQRKQQLDSALIQAQGFHGEVEDLQQWLTDTERQLLASKPVGGLPETAREQLNAHMELCAAFEAKEETYKGLMQKGQQMLARCPESAETNVEQDINNLKEKWESVQTKLSERKTKLEEALNLAMEFHNSLQDFINWLTQAEQTLTAASRPSLILDTVLFQIDEHKVFATEVNSHRDQVIELDKTGTHLKYFSQKQDVVLIKNLLISVQSRWEKVVQRLVERGRALDDARKRAKQFHEAWHKLMEWLEESEKSLDSDLEIANDPDKIKMQLAQHKEFQKSLGAKHSVYDTTNRTGRSLKEKTTLADDNLKLDDMLSELRDKWDTICGKSVERQNKLEEALLFSGQFTDALQALIDWLYKIEPQLAEDQPVHGDIDLVMNLIDNHKVFQKELGKRTSSVQALKRSARELIEGSRDDSSWVKVQMQELSTRWETVCALSVSKQTRLEQALRQAEEFHSVVHVLLEWLAEAEQALRFHGILPDDEEALRTLIEQHREFMKKLEEKKAELNKATGMGEAILAICHPDSITTIKHWITIIRARFEEVLAWAKQHQQRLAGALAGLIANQELLEALLSWLQWAETTLTEKDKEVIPQEIEEVKALIAEHQTFMEEMTRKQPDVDKVTKTYKRKALEPSPVQSHIPVLDKGRAGRKRSPTPGIYPSAAQAQIETKNPRVNLLVSKWQQVWLLALERRRKLNDALDRLEELREFANFDFDIWRKKYMRWMNHKKSRVMDFFRRIDKDQDGKITRQEFIDGILSSKFPTSRLEMSAVADIFDRDGDGYIDYYEFVAALHPNKDAYKPLTDADKIEDEVTRQVAKCKCAKRFQVEQIGDNKYRFFLGNQFGDSQQLRLVRILRSTVMVRVGGGWMALDEFLVKNDPCRVHHHGSKMLRSESNSSITTQPTIAKGRTNVELREKFILADGASQSMAAFRPRGRRSRPSSRGASPNRSTSLSSQAGQAAAPQAVATSTPKTSHHLTRNYGKPWLTNSKTSTPSKPPESSDYQGSSAEGTPIQGSKLRLPGYLSGKGFHSGEDSGILSTAATRVRAQFADTRRTPSRPGSRAGSKAGSRSSSRRGSDASDFDISEIQSVCSDMSETVPATSRPTPRAGSRPGSAKPSKIPTPQRRPLASKSDKSLKR
ncbi:dystonin-like isoform X6 [Camarhynchus parvulus]|uniref:dystonin-like isoform X6 n=1 Tax=Geospiza parvula TaxID=87175 RepID=UPI001237B032|nr:dystonin-like isoform X6 [Camarhynchus parvulus]